MTEPPFDIERIREDLEARKTKSPRVLTPARRKPDYRFRWWAFGMGVGCFVTNAMWVIFW